MACKVYQEEASVRTTSRFQVLDVTGRVEEAVSKSGVTKGLAMVYVPHTTCGITINEAEPGLMEDIVEFLREHTKPGAPWKHNRIDDNAHAHLGQSLLGHHASIPVTGGRLNMGTWQRILLVEMDGPRRRRIIITVIGE
ncbi:MAG: secondary thiamine-phosphate synthase enzyme YjbQ [Desulfurococcales archaeon]|nr:secondary thiamine-phosphate synthase enzyme YjbQ [Desulfurococcales archaeon]